MLEHSSPIPIYLQLIFKTSDKVLTKWHLEKVGFLTLYELMENKMESSALFWNNE